MKLSPRFMAVCATSVSLLLAGCDGNSLNTSAVSGTSSATAAAITTQPASTVIATGSNTTLSVVAAGSNLSYQWYKDGTAISGATAATYTATAAGTYYVVVTSSDGSVTSANAVITVTDAPVITAQPVMATILTGTTQTLTVTVTGSGLSYQWYKDGSAISGAVGASYAASDAGSYTVVVTNAAGTTTSAAAVITVVTTATTPTITSQPTSQTVNSGTSTSLSVAASGVSLTYQWYKDGTAIAGATTASYAIANVSSASAGSYTVVVSSAGQTVTSNSITLTVNVVSAGSNTPAVVTAANAFLATLTSTQKTVATSATDATTVLFDYTLANAIEWTNLPGDRHGLRLNTTALSATQLAAANKVISAALSATGLTLMTELRAADDVLATAEAANGGIAGGTAPTGTIPTGTVPTGTIPTGTIPTGTLPTGGTGTGTGGVTLTYGSGQYSIAFIGTPSTASPWMLQLVGHHLAYNISYNAGAVSATPLFIGVEPPNWTANADGTVTVTNTAASTGTAHAPLEQQRVAVYNLAQSIYADSTTAAAAKLTGTFTDVVMGASGNTDGNYKTLAYPSSGRGLQYSAMNTTQQGYVKAAIEAWVNTQAADIASTLLGSYLSADALSNTYVGYGVGQNGTTADFSAYPNSVAAPLDAQRSYIRIDGPRVWIEFVVQQGIVYGSDIHYHTIWRDKTADYGGSF